MLVGKISIRGVCAVKAVIHRKHRESMLCKKSQLSYVGCTVPMAQRPSHNFIIHIPSGNTRLHALHLGKIYLLLVTEQCQQSKRQQDQCVII